MAKKAERMQMLQQNFKITWLDIFFPYHLFFGGQITLDPDTYDFQDDEPVTIYTSLKYYRVQNTMMLWMHNAKF